MEYCHDTWCHICISVLDNKICPTRKISHKCRRNKCPNHDLSDANLQQKILEEQYKEEYKRLQEENKKKYFFYK